MVNDDNVYIPSPLLMQCLPILFHDSKTVCKWEIGINKHS